MAPIQQCMFVGTVCQCYGTDFWSVLGVRGLQMNHCLEIVNELLIEHLIAELCTGYSLAHHTINKNHCRAESINLLFARMEFVSI